MKRNIPSRQNYSKNKFNEDTYTINKFNTNRIAGENIITNTPKIKTNLTYKTNNDNTKINC
jgi:hypothetical protein